MSKLISDENDLRIRLFEIIRKEPQSIREYTRRIGFGKAGNAKTLQNFLYGTRKSTFLTLLKIERFLESYEQLVI